MEIRFTHRGRSAVVDLAAMRYEPGRCAGQGEWLTVGWWTLRRHYTFYIFDTDNRYFAFYAEGTSGSAWTGDYGAWVVQPAFEVCQEPPGTAGFRRVGMQLVDTQGNDTLVTLTD